nr:hypothetical protein [Tanacetum cinerariifolium]
MSSSSYHAIVTYTSSSDNSELIEDDLYEAEEEGEELTTPVASTIAIADPASPSDEIEPFEEDEVAPTPPSPASPIITPLSHTQLHRTRMLVRPPSSLPPPIDASDAERQPGSTLTLNTRDRLVVALVQTKQRLADLATRYRQDIHEMYMRL